MKLKSNLYYFVFTILIIINIGFGCFHSLAANRDKKGQLGDENLTLLIEQSKSFLNISSTQVRKYAYKALILATAYDDTASMAISNSYLGASFIMDQEYDTAFVLLFNAEKLAQSIRNKEILVKVYNNLGSLFELISDEKNAIDYYTLATQLIKLNGLDYIYKPRLSLAKYYCSKGEFSVAQGIINQVIQDAHENGDLIDEVRGHMNLLNARLEYHAISYKKAQQTFDTIINHYQQLEEDEKIELRRNKEMIQLKLFQLKGDYQRVNSYSLQLLKESNLSFTMRLKILKILVQSLKEESMYGHAFEVQSQIDSIYSAEILKLKTTAAKNNQALYELSNQKIILDQIVSDRENEKVENRKKHFYLILSLIINGLFVFLLFYVIYIFRIKKPIVKPKSIVDKPSGFMKDDEINISEIQLFETPSFVLNSELIYQNANRKFISLSGKERLEAIRGCNEFDMPWAEFGEQLHAFYQEVKLKKLPIFVDAKYFNQNQFEKVLLLPLYDALRFKGIIGIMYKVNAKMDEEIISNSLETDQKSNIIQQEEMQKRVLIVEDEVDNIILIKRFLRDIKIDLVIAKSGEEAINICQEQMFDIILLDLHFSGMSGMDSLLEIRKINQFDKVKVLAMTASSKDELSEDELEAFDDFIFKPIKKEVLINKLSISQLQ